MDELGCGFYFNAANVGPYMSLDETCLSNGEVWTSLTNKEGKGGKGTLAAAIPGTRSDEIHNTSIINYFEQRFTNASAESFNANIKAFRTQFRGVGDVKFFMYRLSKLSG